MKIEPFSLENVAYAVQLCKELWAAGTFGVNGPDFDWDYTIAGMRNIVDDPSFYLRLAYDDDDAPCGFVGGNVVQFWFNPKVAAYEQAWFVREGTKGRTKIAVKLMRGFLDWAFDEKGALLVQSGDIASIDSIAVDSLYKHLGFKRYGSVYKYTREA